MFIANMKRILADPNATPFEWDNRVDLLDAPTISEGIFIVFEDTVPNGQTWLIKAVMPHVYARTNVGTINENYRALTPQEANGYFSWELQVAGEAPTISANYNSPRLASAPQDSDRANLNGISFISESPHADAAKSWGNPLFTIRAEAGRLVQVLFRINPLGATSPIPNGYSVGGLTVGTRRVDFAGCLLVGVVSGSQIYDQEAERLQNPR